MHPKATTLGALRKDVEAGRVARRSVKSEIRENLIRKLRAGETLFPGIVGYDDTVVPQVVNAILSRHNFILLGLRGQAKTRMLRALTDAARRGAAGRPGLRDQRRPARADVRGVPRARCARRATTAGRVARARPALRREARDARRDDRRHDRRHRSDQGGARQPRARPTS